MQDKVEHAREIIREAIRDYPRIAVACSFGKDSIVTLHLARQVDPDIRVFSIMTPYKPKETFEYLKVMNQRWHLNTVVYMVADAIPGILRDGSSLDVRLSPPREFEQKSLQAKARTGKELYEVDPDECCRLLKVVPTRVAVSDLDAWICGLRNTEGRTRQDYQEVERRDGLVKINPILNFTEAEVWRYIATRGIEPHPWYAKGYRSLGCTPCSRPGGVLERDGRWRNTSKCGGECGIHTQRLK